MRTWPFCLVLLSCLGCQTVFTPPSRLSHSSNAPSAVSKADTPPTSPEAHVDSAKDNRHLTLAAIYLDQGQDEKACLQLQFFLDAHPDHAGARYYRAEVLRKLGKADHAKREFETTEALLQEEKLLDLRKLIHLNGRLADIAEEGGDDYARCLHRGIALYWLSQAPAGSDEEEQLAPAEGLLCKAAAALAEAHDLNAEAARPVWYLHLVWRKLGQAEPARRFLGLAQARASFAHLQPAEHREMILVENELIRPSPEAGR